MPYLSHNYRFETKSRAKSLVESFVFVIISAVAIFFTLFVLGWISASAAQAAAGINTQINYQGKLNNKTAGTAVADGSWRMRFRLYNQATDGTLLWTERWSTTTVEVNTVNGIFSVALGTYTSLDSVDFNSDALYLQIDMDADEIASGDWEESFSDRKRLTATPYAFNADTIDGIHATSTVAVANYLLALDAQGNLDLFDKGVSSTYVTTTAWLNVGSTDVVATFGSLIGKGDLFVGNNATVTNNLFVGGFASTTNLVLGNDGSNLGTYSDLYVSSGNLFFDAIQLTGAGGLSFWQYTFEGNITPTSTTAGLYITASSTIAANFRVDGDFNVTGNATTSGYLVVGTADPTTTLVPGDVNISNFLRVGTDTNVPSGGRLLIGTNHGGGSYIAKFEGTNAVDSHGVRIETAMNLNTNFGLEVVNNISRTDFVVTTAGNVGVSTSSPLFLFQVGSIFTDNTYFSVDSSGNATTSGRLVVGTNFPPDAFGTGDLFVGSNATVTNNLFVGGFASTTNLVFSDSGSNFGGAPNLYVSSGNLFYNAIQLTGAAGFGINNWVFGTANLNNFIRPTTTVDLFFPSRLGIGTSTPQALLSISTSTGKLLGSSLLFQVASTTNAGINNSFVITADERIGIGTATPGAIFHISDGSNDLFQVTDEGSIGSASTTGFFVIGTGLGGISPSAGDLIVSGNATTSGYFVIGTVNPVTNLSAGDLFVGSNATTSGTMSVTELEISDDNFTDLVGDATLSFVSGTLRVIDLNCTNCIGPTEITDLTLGTDTAGDFVGTITGGVGIDSTGATTGENIDHTLSFNAAELDALTWDAGTLASIAWTWSLSGSTDPTLTFADSLVTFNTGIAVSGLNITNVGDIALDTISSDGTSIVIGSGNSNTITLTDNTSIAIALGSDAGDDFTIDGTGFVYEGDNNRVGIGTASPGANLEIQETLGDAAEAPFIVLDSDNLTVGSGSSIQWKNNNTTGAGYYAAIAGIDDSLFDGRIEFRVSNDSIRTTSALTSSDTVMTIIQTGNVGVGTTTPQAILSVSSPVGTLFGTDLLFQVASTTNAGINNALTVTADGILTTGGHTINIEGDVAEHSFLRGNGNNFNIIMDYTDATGGGTFSIYDDAWLTTTIFSVDDTNGIYANKFIMANSATLCWDSSGGSLITGCDSLSKDKKNQVTLSLGLETLMQLSPREYDWVPEMNNGAHDLGFIAEEVAAVNPLLAQYRNPETPEEELSGVKYRHMVALLTKAIQELNIKVDNLRVSTSSPASSSKPIVVVDNPDLNIDTLVVQQAATFYGTLYVQGEAGFAHKVVFEEDIEIKGKVYVSADQAGTAVIPANATSTEIVFENEYEVAPEITATIKGIYEIFYGIENITTQGFTLGISQLQEHGLEFSWIALAVKDESIVLGSAPPIIDSLTASREQVGFDIPVELWVQASDEDTDPQDLSYTWIMEPSIGTIDNPNSGLVFWRVAEGEIASTTEVTITVEVSDGQSEVRESVIVTVLAEGPTTQEPPANPAPEPEEPAEEELPVEETTEVAVDPPEESTEPEEEVVVEEPPEEVVVEDDESVVQTEDILEDPGELEVSTL